MRLGRVNEAAGDPDPVSPTISAAREPRTERTYCNHGTDDEAMHTSAFCARWRASSCSPRSPLGCSAAAAPPAGGDYGGQHPDYAPGPGRRPGAAGGALLRRPTSCSRAATDAYEERIAALRGYPVVANVWASWCGPCRHEFPTPAAALGPLRQAGRLPRHRLRRTPTTPPRPSSRRHRSPTRATPTPTASSPIRSAPRCGLPDTAFYDRAGEARSTSSRAPTPTQAELEEDLERYALESG